MGERRRAHRSGNSLRAQQLLVGGAVGGHVAALLVVSVALVFWGPESGISAAVASAIALAFNVIGHAVQVIVVDADPRVVLIAAMASYTGRVTLLGLVLMLVLANAERFVWMQPIAIIWGIVAVVFGWLTAEFWVYSRLRIPVYDPPEDQLPARVPRQEVDGDCAVADDHC